VPAFRKIWFQGFPIKFGRHRPPSLNLAIEHFDSSVFVLIRWNAGVKGRCRSTVARCGARMYYSVLTLFRVIYPVVIFDVSDTHIFSGHRNWALVPSVELKTPFEVSLQGPGPSISGWVMPISSAYRDVRRPIGPSPHHFAAAWPASRLAVRAFQRQKTMLTISSNNRLQTVNRLDRNVFTSPPV
jgi:hypothetical protein